MTESEWLASTGVVMMAQHLAGGPLRLRIRDIDVRRLRLWVEACRLRAEGPPARWSNDLATDDQVREAAADWMRSGPGISHGDTCPDGVRCDILRCVFPYSPVVLPAGPDVNCRTCHGVGLVPARAPHTSKRCPTCHKKGTVPGPSPWLTPTVLNLAHAARGEPCPSCDATGKCRRYNPIRRRRLKDGPCPRCSGTGALDFRTLDPARLAVLSDALEEAGCDDADILNHLRGRGRCPHCVELRRGIEKMKTLAWLARQRGERIMAAGDVGCSECDGGFIPLAVPHCRGCWALDLVLGRA